MAGDQDRKEKPKVTLIKHKRQDEPSDAVFTSDRSEKQEKKKVVVVKKKVVKKPQAKVVVHRDDERPEDQTAHFQEEQVKNVQSHTVSEIQEKPIASAQDHGAQEIVEHAQIIPPETVRKVQTGTEPEKKEHVVKPGNNDAVRPGRPAPDNRSGNDRPARQWESRPSDRDDRPARSPDDRNQNPRPGYQGGQGYQGQRPGYQGGQSGQGGQGQRPGYQGSQGYQGQRPGYQGGQGGQGYQGQRPGYQGGQGYQGQRPGYQGGGQGGQGYQGQRPGYQGGQGGQGYQGQRPGYQGGQGYQGQRPGYQGGQGGQGQRFRSPQRPGSAPRPGSTPTTPIEEKKQTGKKFFKAKKKEVYSKKDREEHEEKILQQKKKSLQKINPVPKSIDIMEVITVSELARKMNLKASDLIAKLMSMGMMVTINQQIDAETASILASEYDCTVNIVSLYEQTIIETESDVEEDLLPRPPIVTIMGHVDHGKTKLLDAIRTADVASSEFGGITQHIGAYTVVLPTGGRITFLDTPGHEAFTLMRARGAQITDIVILVVAANDGVMPQTIEAINHAKDAKVPIIVAINKIDLPEANPDRVKQQLAEYDLSPEEWGGSTLYNEISALKKVGIQELLETILLQAEILDLKANYDCRAEGKVIESKVDHGRGIVSTVLIERGTLRIGDSFIAGVFPGKVRAMFSDKGERLEEATPSMPVEILGFTGIPNAGSPFQATETEKLARQVGSKRQELKKMEEAKNVKKITLDNLYDSIKEGGIQELKVVIKGDVHGSVEALQTALEKLSTKEIRLVVIHASAGAINEGDIMLASASNAIVIGFHVRPTAKAMMVADQEKVDVRKYNIIYDAVESIRAAMEGLLAPELLEETIGTVEVRDTFKVPKIGVIAGCYVTSGKVKRNAIIHVVRDGVELYAGKITSLKRFKDDAREVETGYECGIGIENFHDLKVGDQLDIIEIREVAKKLQEGK